MASTSKTSNKITGHLKKIIGAPVGEIFILTSGEVTIGRNRQCADICFQDPNVSRSHCVLNYSENGWFIKDLKSVNGTYLDGKILDPEIAYPLKDCAGIYLGPPGEAPVAFIFLSKMPNEQSCEINVFGYSPRNRPGTTRLQLLAPKKSDNCMKRQSESESNECFSQRKKIATSLSSANILSRIQDLGGYEIWEDSDSSDCSISSLDSLMTRVRKRSAQKDKRKNLISTIRAASISASPQLMASSYASLESKPSTSGGLIILNSKINKAQRAAFKNMFSESESSTPDTVKGEDDSQSLLNDSKILIDCEPYPFSQPLPAETAQGKQKKDKNNREHDEKGSMEEQLQKASLELKKLKKDRLHLSHLVKRFESEEYKKKTEKRFEFLKMLEDELMCTICTEVFMKAVILNCCHTFCEFCIWEWKKKKKQCPICREKISSERKVLVLDSLINKAVEESGIETQNRRKELSTTREAKVKQPKRKSKRGRGRQIRSDSSDAEVINTLAEQNSFDELYQPSSSPSIEVLHRDDLGTISSSDFSDITAESDVSVEGSGYFGGYGRCYNCGRRGHWANGCPYV